MWWWGGGGSVLVMHCCMGLTNSVNKELGLGWKVVIDDIIQ